MKLSEDFVPSTVDEAVEALFKACEKEDLEYIKGNTSGTIHFTFGMALRNGWSFWQQGTPLQLDFKKRFNLFGHADDMSGVIIDGLWAKVRGEDVEKAMTECVEDIRLHWNKYGVDPVTGKETGKKKKGAK